SSAEYRSSMDGLKTSTRFRAIMARRNRRISSSLLPENMGPQITSIHPMLPVMMSIEKVRMAHHSPYDNRPDSPPPFPRSDTRSCWALLSLLAASTLATSHTRWPDMARTVLCVCSADTLVGVLAL